MNIPTEIIGDVLAVILTAVIGLQVWLFKRINKIERTLLTIVIMLADRGFKIPDGGDTERLLKASRREGI
ncbi:MAG TPA: hypothetical protein VNV43_00230 [Candidatus Acidoferrales bacterium]|jgi:hypothetical protein|nr:hypothetical protein [Candidatus Acidoferrales bacterium]